MESKLPKITQLFEPGAAEKTTALSKQFTGYALEDAEKIKQMVATLATDGHFVHSSDEISERLKELMRGWRPDQMVLLSAADFNVNIHRISQKAGNALFLLSEINSLGGDYSLETIHRAKRRAGDSTKYWLDYDAFDILDALAEEGQELKRQRDASRTGWNRKVKHHNRAPISIKTGNPSNLLLKLVGKL